MRHDFINDPPVSVYIFDFQLVVVIFQSQQQRKMFKGFLKPQARLLVQVHEAKNKREDLPLPQGFSFIGPSSVRTKKHALLGAN